MLRRLLNGIHFPLLFAVVALAAVAGILTAANAYATNYTNGPTSGLTQANLTNPQIQIVQPMGPALAPVINTFI